MQSFLDLETIFQIDEVLIFVFLYLINSIIKYFHAAHICIFSVRLIFTTFATPT